MNTLNLVLTWIAKNGYWFVLAGLVAALCVRNPLKRRPLVRILLVFGGLIVGSIFLAAAYGKLKPLAGLPLSLRSLKTSIFFFQIQVQSYQILSPAAANLVAHVLPFFELFLGLWLVSGIGRRFSSLLASLVFLGFMSAIAYAYFRGLHITCGCGIGEDEEVGPHALLRDGLRFFLPCLLVTIGAFWVHAKPSPASVSAPATATTTPSLP
jgi:uncharacterized membrane protein YphA (DoxX/SURF4 family)